MEMLLLLTQRRNCSLILDLSNQSGQIGWLRQPEYQAYRHVSSIGLHCYSNQTRFINFYAHVGYFKRHSKLKLRVNEGFEWYNTN